MTPKTKMLLWAVGLGAFLIPVKKRMITSDWRGLEWKRDLNGTVPAARPHFEQLIAQAKAWGMRPWLISALRPCTKVKPGSKVAGCRSWHALGRAVDVQLQSARGKIDDREPYEKLGRWWEEKGGIWGGDFGGYPNGVPGFEKAGPGDVAHFQWTDGLAVVPDSICSHDDCEASVASYLDSQWGDAEKATV